MRRKPLVYVVLGTRPEIIKLAPVILALRRRKDLDCRVCATGQHRELSRQLLQNFGLRPDENLRLMRPDQSLNAFSARALAGLGAVFAKRRPQLVIVQGDTSTALMGALAAFHEGVPVAHVEAGLRTFDRGNPFPEELNRVLIDQLAELHFAPTPEAGRRVAETGGRALVTGNTVIDALRLALARRAAVRAPRLRAALAALGPRDVMVLATMHRRESFGAVMAGFCRAFRALVDANPRLHLFFPVHLNPRARRSIGAALRHPRVHLLPALDYLDLALVLKRCRFVLTDSGGLQEEAPSLGKPVLILRKVTERREAVRAGVARLAGVEEGKIAALASRLLRDERLYRSMARRVDLFGDGRAGERIAQAVRRRFGLTRARPTDFKPRR